MTIDKYKAAGVDIDAGNEVARRYGRLAELTHRPEVLGRIGGFAGGFALDVSRYPEPILLSGTDGVGTKLKVAFAANKHNTIGIDCVAMCVNDILTSGAEPLFFLDYLATSSLDVPVAEAIVSGVSRGCEDAGCALVGGETAEMPGMYADKEYDIAGFAVGVVNRPDMIDGSSIQPGDLILGLASHGLHSNGYSLVRKLVQDAGLAWTDNVPGFAGTVAEELLIPTRIYVKSVHAVLSAGKAIRGMAHITGGGLLENIPRCLPRGVEARITIGSWPVRKLFSWLQEQANMTFLEASRIWNMGIGYVLIVPAKEATEVSRILTEHGESVYSIGKVAEGNQQVVFV
jgi:phosphoribosylformylglycinamidine cyclo-ligase